MTILPSIDIFKKYVSHTRDKVFSDVNSIFYNQNNNFLLSQNYLEVLQNNIEDYHLVQLLIVELMDNNKIPKGIVDNSSESIYENLYNDNIDKMESLFAITIDETPKNNHFSYSKIANKNKEFILFELLKTNNVTFHYFHFKDNKEIQELLKTVFSIPTKIGKICIYNRYSEYNYLTFLKHKSIHYYNLISGNSQKQNTEFIRIKNELKENLGRNLILKYTTNKTIIHERKIFFKHFILTTDQSFNNLLVNEPNWKIDIQVDNKNCFNEWSKKSKNFQER